MVRGWQDLSVLIAGCGSIGKRHARVLDGLGVRDVRACDPVGGQRESLLAQVPTVKMYETYEAGLADHPDTVLICTPPWLHVPQAVQAIRAGGHVLCEKPLSDSTDGVDELAAVAEGEHKKVMVALCFRYHDGLVKARRTLDAGRIGRLVSIRALVGEHLPDVRPDYRDLFSTQHGGAFDLMHEIDLAVWYAQEPVAEVRCLSGTYSDIGISAPDLAEILIGFESRRSPPGGCLASIHLDFFQRPRRRQIELIGTDGVIIVEFARWDSCTVSIYEAAKAAWEHEELVTDRDDMFRAEDSEFLRAVAEDGTIRCTIAEARKSVEVVLACQTGAV
jgi:UDP-N-acetylglucosamine 3-dehydrogenase